MSSMWRVLCLSHDPAIEATEFHSMAEAIQAAGEPAGYVVDHQGCDLMVGRYSYPLMELICVGGGRCSHRDVRRVDADWLRLLAVAHPIEDPKLRAAVEPLSRRNCWHRERLERLRVELRLEEQP